MKELTHIAVNVLIYLLIVYIYISFSYLTFFIVILYSVIPDLDSRFSKIKDKIKLSWFFKKKRIFHNLLYAVLLSFPLIIFGFVNFLAGFISYLLHLLEDKMVGK